MKNKKLLFCFIPVIAVLVSFYGYNIQDQPNTELKNTPEYSQTVLGNPPVMPMAVGDSCAGTGQEKHDDGSLENGGGWNSTVTDGRLVLKFRPNSYPWKYTKFCIAMTRLAAGPDSLKFDVVIYDSTGAGGAPGTLIGTLPNQIARPVLVFNQYSWFSYDLSSLAAATVNSGAVYIGIKYDASIATQASKFVMFDESAGTTLWPGYAWANAGPWTTAQTYWATYKSWGMRTIGQPAGPPPGNSTLVLVHDSTNADTPKRKADRDTLNAYLSRYVSGYTVKPMDTTRTLDSLSNYRTVILMETSFDAANVRYLGAAARTQLKAWLNSGTAGNKKSLISIGGDQAYNYSRSGSAGRDLEFAETIGKYTYILDNAQSTNPAIEGVAIDAGNQRSMTTTPVGSGYWPDGCSVVAGGSSVLYRYTNHTANDTVAAIGNNQTGYLCATIFQDPRYFNGGFGEVLKAVVGWVRTNGGVITGVSNQSSVMLNPDDFNLAQNYPNPFNPETRISFSIPSKGLVTLKVFDMLGREVSSLVNEVKNAGVYDVKFNASALPSGTYFYRLETGNFVSTKKMMLIK
jgi:hypothetical protein